MRWQGAKYLYGLLAAVLITACFGFAAPRKDRKTDITFNTTAKFNNGDTLAAGTYQMQVPADSTSPHVTFTQNGKVMATVPAQVVTEQKKNSETEVVAQTEGSAQAVSAIRPAGWNEKLVFGSQNH